MPSYRRSRVAGGSYFFTVVSYKRRPFLTEARARHCLRSALRAVRDRHPFALDAIVLLPDHIHCVWTLPSGDSDYSTRWSRIKTSFTKRYLNAGGEDTGVSVSRVVRGERGIWQRRFYERTITNDAHFKQCIDYVHINPIKHRLVERVRDWPWSSFHRYIRLGEYEDTWGGSNALFTKEWDTCE